MIIPKKQNRAKSIQALVSERTLKDFDRKCARLNVRRADVIRSLVRDWIDTDKGELE